MIASKAQLRMRLHLLAIGLDGAALLFAHAMAGAFRFGDPFDPQAMKLCAALVPFYAAGAFAVNGYSTATLLVTRHSIRCALKALALAVTGAVFFIFLLQFGNHVSRLTFAVAGATAVVGLAAVRWFLARNATELLGGSAFDVLVICDGVAGGTVARGTVHVDAAGIDPTSPTPATLDRLGRLVAGADRVVVACPAERRALWVATLQGANVRGEVMAPELAGLNPLGTAAHDGVPTLIVAQQSLALRDRVLKRALDVIVAGALLTVGAPVLLAAAMAVRLSGPGPILFRQPRIGRRNMQFDCLKFRTMHVADADHAGHRSTAPDDDRITRFGRVLRTTSIDELPQLINVLKGDMSMVGPRPHALGSRAEDQLFWDLDSTYWHRHSVKPGLTGLAQVRGFRGATTRRTDLTNRLQADLEYRRNWSIWTDIAILARTAPALLQRGAF